MKEHQIAITILLQEYYKLGGKIFADFFMRNKASDDEKKSIEANDFLMGMLNGEIKKEWKLEETEDYKKLCSLVKSINYLSNSSSQK